MYGADIVMIDGRIITVESNLEEAIAIKDNKILAVGSDLEIKRFIGERTRVIDLEGRSVLPGFEDSHIHLLATAARSIDLRPDTTPDMRAFLEKIEEKAVPEGEWIIGSGWNQDKIEWGRDYKWPTKEDLDEVAPDNPVYLLRICGHIAVCNSRALELANINRKTPQPEGGWMDKYPDGELTGILRESAMEQVKREIPVRSYDDLQRMIELAISNGITCIEEAGLSWREVELYERALERGSLPVRVKILLNSDLLDDAIERGISSPHQIQKLRICGIKFFSDGSLGGRTAALKEPYSDDPLTSGILEHDLRWFTRQFTKAHSSGLQCSTHAIGDLANEVVLEANKRSYEAIEDEPGRYRDRIEHCQILSPSIIEEYKEQDMIASIQFSFATSDAGWGELRLGRERIEYSYAWRKLLDWGVRCCGGTDSPVETYIPLEGVQNILETGLTIEEAIELYTINSAYAQLQDDYLGSLKEGKLADLIVLSGDILNTPPAKLKVELTMIDGKVVYESRKGSEGWTNIQTQKKED